MVRAPRPRMARLAAFALAIVAGGWAPSGAAVRPAAHRPGAPAPIQHVIEIMLENHTFDNLFGHFPGADGVPQGATLPNPVVTTPALPAVHPVVASANEGDVLGVIDNSRAGELAAMDGHPGSGYRMDRYTLHRQDGMAAITLTPPADDPNLQALARQYTLAERNFQPAIAPTQPNVLYALAATANGWMVNATPPPQLGWHSIFDALTRAHRSWRIYYGVPPSVLQGSVWYRLIPPGTAPDITGTGAFLGDLRGGALPDFSLVRPGVGYSQEPPEDVQEGDAWLGQLVEAVAHSRYWRSTALFITYDEGGGFWDHVQPPVVTRYGYGTRTPMVMVSPWARRGLDPRTTTNLSVLAFMAHLWRLAPLDQLAARQDALASAFDYRQRPLPPPRLPTVPPRTLVFTGATPLSDPPPVAPGQGLVLHLRANTAGLALDRGLSGPVALRLVPPAGTPVPAHFPVAVRLTRGEATLAVRLPLRGYYRLLAAGPGGSRGWLTLDVGVTPETVPAPAG